MEEISLFSIPLYKFKFADHELHKPKIMKYLSNEKVYKDNSRRHIDFSGPNLHNLPEFSEFAKFAMDSLNESMINLGYVPSIQITSLWATRHRENLFHHRHTHNNSFLVGVYYLNGSTKNSGTTFFTNNRCNQIVPARLPNTKLRIASKWTSSFEEGTLLIFPSWLEHDTDVNILINSDRYILSFNSMPVGKTTSDIFDRYNYQDISNADMISSQDKRI